MTIQITTTGTTPATITERELFSHFAYSDIKHTASFGPSVLDYSPSDYLREGGTFGKLVDVTSALADELEVSEQPGEDLDNLIDGIKEYLRGLIVVQRDYHSYREVYGAKPEGDEPDQSDTIAFNSWEEKWKEHDRAPRFRAPAELAE